MATLSLCLIVKDETDTLDACLKSASSIADEIIIVQTVDNWPTKKVANKYNAKTYPFTWINDFSAARNYSFEQATKDYIMWLDADDIIPPSEVDKIRQLKMNITPNIDVVMMDYKVRFDEKGNSLLTVSRERMVRRDKGYKWIGTVHECIDIPPQGHNVIGTDITMVHTTNRTEPNGTRNLDIYKKKYENNDAMISRDLYHYGNELFDHKFFEEAIVIYKEMLEDKDAWVEHAISACLKLGDCYLALNKGEEAVKYFVKTFEYDVPRAEALCQLSVYYLQKQDWRKGILWAKNVFSAEKPEYNPISMEHCWTWFPHQLLAHGLWTIGQFELAYQHNNEILKFKPNDPEALENKAKMEKAIMEMKAQQEAQARPVIKL
jgi:glycosyltransferase involved in cell wall biosynthesis